MKLLGGRADGREINTTEPWIWVAILDGTPRALPNNPGIQTDHLLFRVRPGQWSLYEARGNGAYQWIRDQTWPVGATREASI